MKPVAVATTYLLLDDAPDAEERHEAGKQEGHSDQQVGEQRRQNE